MKIEKILLVIIDDVKQKNWMSTETAYELEELVNACGGEVVEKYFCRMDKPTAAYLVSTGKVEDIVGMCSILEVDTVIFSQDLKGSQQRNLEEKIKVKIIDRTQLILDIFARHAKSREGKMQVELAQLEYLLPRLTGKGVEMSRLGGGIGTLGPGETKLEVDRRRISQRITKLKRSLTDVAANRATKRKRRQDKGVPSISLVGYTNAGKSTLLNRLTDSQQTTKNGLFTTLDPLSRQLVLPNHQNIVLSDTVGFMHDLPHKLIESFKATLEEVVEADMLLHVLDVSHPHFRHLFDSVKDVLIELGVTDKPMITVLNKIDKFKDPLEMESLKNVFSDSVFVSAATGDNISCLLTSITRKLADIFSMVKVDCIIPISRMDLVNLAHKEGEVDVVEYIEETIHLKVTLPQKYIKIFNEVKIK